MRTLLLATMVLSAALAHAQCESPVQADVLVPLGTEPSRFRTRLEPGDATLRGRVRPQRGRETARVELRFDYRVPKNLLVFDEIICSIETIVEDAEGNELGRALIDPNTVNLNPNRVPLYYATTLYTIGGTRLRVRVRGNYE